MNSQFNIFRQIEILKNDEYQHLQHLDMISALLVRNYAENNKKYVFTVYRLTEINYIV